jgi:hypothetical protein
MEVGMTDDQTYDQPQVESPSDEPQADSRPADVITRGDGTTRPMSAAERRAAEIKAKPSEQVLQFFKYEHLPPHLQDVSRVLSEAARKIADSLPESAEKTVGLRKLLEAKDCFVRAAMVR